MTRLQLFGVALGTMALLAVPGGARYPPRRGAGAAPAGGPGVDPKEMRFVELAPPDMPAALASGAIEGYFIGEPHAARAELDGTGRVLHHVKDVWPRFISCVLVVHERLIAERPEVVRDLVRG